MNKEMLNGLSPEEVAVSRQQHGSNVLTPPKRASFWKLYIDKYRDPIIQILLFAILISLVFSFIEGEFVETIGIALAVFFATTVGFYFELDATHKFDVLNALSQEQLVKVRREGAVRQVPRSEVVVGDIVMIETGDEIPADGLLLEAVDLEVNESSLTGELLAHKYAELSRGQEESTFPANRVLRSTMVIGGRGLMRVDAVGDRTEIGLVARQAMEMSQVKTPLGLQLENLAKIISKIGVFVSISAFLLFLIHDIIVNDAVWRGENYLLMAEHVLKYFMMAVTLIVMAVPEGLPMAITLSLALNMRRMLKSNNLVRKLHSCETMGAVTVICTDKTGTLTENRMKVRDVLLTQNAGMQRVMNESLALNSTAELSGEDGIGNPTEVALLRFLRANGVDYLQLRETAAILEQNPFSTEKKYMRTVAQIDDRCYEFVKGAPEIVLATCSFEGDDRQQVEETLKQWQRQGMRTLAFTCNGNFQAIVSIVDPVRSDVPAAVAACQQAGINIKVVTGDTSLTAIEIARQIGIVDDEDGEVLSTSGQHVTGSDFAAMSEQEALACAARLKVMSRARPDDKRRLVMCLQQLGEVVAVTGDGTNDAPALNAAHVGLSLGSGTFVAKEASDMTLLDDSFSSIAKAVMWGRSLYKNIQRFLFFQLVVNLTALLLVLAGSLVGTELPLTVTQILWVNLIMDTFAAMALASLSPTKEVMSDRPRANDEFIITPYILKRILLFSVLFFIIAFAGLVYCEHHGDGVDVHELTLFFTVFVMLQVWNLFNARDLGTNRSLLTDLCREKSFLLVFLLTLSGQWAIVEFGGKMFRTDGMSLVEWLVVIGTTSVVMWMGELARWIGRRRDRKIMGKNMKIQ